MGKHRRERTTPEPSRRQILGGGTMLAAALLLGGSAPPTAQAAPAAPVATSFFVPQVHGRQAWEAREAAWSAQVLDEAPRYIVIHHTATDNVTDYSKERAFELSQAVQRHHMDHNGWADVGQQLTISRGGFLMEGRNGSLAAIRAGQHLLGAHVRDHNSVTVGIENEGNYDAEEPNQWLYKSLVETCAWLCTTYGLGSDAIVGHRDLISTNCPGERFYELLPQLRDDVEALLLQQPD